MRLRFNTTGPCFPDEHYMLPPERRLGRIMELIDDGKYFTVHAGRQTGKTTSAQWLAKHYNAGERYRAVWFIHGGGRVEREYGLGRGALDLMITRQGERHAIEVKLRRDTQTEERALAQVARYLDSAGLDEGWLVLFDLRSTQPWEQRLTTRTLEALGKRVRVAGC